MSTFIPKSSFDFLKDLAKNNNRDWFNARKDRYLKEYDHIIAFAEAMIDGMSHHDDIVQTSGKKALHRIYRDTRFSKDKTPYKNNFSGGMKRATKWLRGGYYIHLEPGNTFVGGGFWGPNSADLKRIREEIAVDPESLRKIIQSKDFKSSFGELLGDKVKTSPKGYSKDHPAIDLLRYKQFLCVQHFTDEEAHTEGFLNKVITSFRHMRPFFDYMSDVLTTDSNGVPIA